MLVTTFVVLALMAGLRKAGLPDTPVASANTGRVTMDDREAIARVLVAEAARLHAKVAAGNKDAREEWGGIAWVALNRANRWNASVYEVTTNKVKGRSVWNSSQTYKDRYENAHGSAAWKNAWDFAGEVVEGKVPNQIGERILFVHMAGLQSIPEWIQDPPNPPIVLGRATFV